MVMVVQADDLSGLKWILLKTGADLQRPEKLGYLSIYIYEIYAYTRVYICISIYVYMLIFLYSFLDSHIYLSFFNTSNTV